MSQYKTGTVLVTNGDATVVGTGTSWSGNVAAGDLFTIVGSGVPYYVGSVTDDTHLELTANYAGSTLSGQSYTIGTSRTTTYELDYPESSGSQGGGDIETATIVKSAMVKLDTLLTAIGTPIDNEAPTGTMNGVNPTFTLANAPISGSVRLYYNGMRLKSGSDYSISGSTITMLVLFPNSGESFLADYRTLA